FFHCFSIVFLLFLRRRIFASLRKALHCNWRVFSIVNPLYSSRKIFPRRARRQCAVFLRRPLWGRLEEAQSNTRLHPVLETRKRGRRSQDAICDPPCPRGRAAYPQAQRAPACISLALWRARPDPRPLSSTAERPGCPPISIS